MKQKINLRLIGTAVIAVLATAVGITFIYYGLFKKQVQEDLRINAEILVDTGAFSTGVESKVINESEFPIENLRVTWIGADGTVLYDNDNNPQDMQNHFDRPEVQNALDKGSGECIRKSDTMNMSTFYYALKQEDGSVIRVSRDAGNIINVFVNVFPTILLIIVVIIAVCIIISHFLTKTLLEPIENMAKNIEDTQGRPVYKEMEPFAEKIRLQHENILAAARSRQDFTANVSHELKTPLTAISGYAELIENEMVSHEQEIHFAHEIKKNSERLLCLINDIIRLSELDHKEMPRKYENFDLYEFLRDCSESLKVSAAKQNIMFSYSGAPCTIRGNKDMIRELIDNLVQNAIRYNKEGGHVEVFAGLVDGKPQLKVKDDGIGIPKDQQERIFERFYRVDKSRSKETGGTGLGLAIVKHIVELHDARIYIESEVDKGTEIWVEF
ncbi:MAG: ATP-binding protein [Clostridia bacterium]|nr:ATP-binding protein [Clostridia bacterium]